MKLQWHGGALVFNKQKSAILESVNTSDESVIFLSAAAEMRLDRFAK